MVTVIMSNTKEIKKCQVSEMR